MAWRPTRYLLAGELDNTVLGKVTGWMEFAGLNDRVSFALDGDFHRDIRGTKIRLKVDSQHDEDEARDYMDGFSTVQTGKAGDITAGGEPVDYVAYPYIEWYSEDNGRVVIELEADQVEILGTPIPACQCQPTSRAVQAENMRDFCCKVGQHIREGLGVDLKGGA